MSRLRIWTLRLLTAGLSAAATLTAIELSLRLAIGHTRVDLFVYSADAQRAKLMRPNVRALIYGRPIETNGSGYRARREYGAEKPAGVRRIVVIGDSFTFGTGVPFEQIITTRLEAMLNEAYAPRTFEVYNLAVGGHELLHHAATVREVALAYAPDLLLMFIFPYNDFETGGYDDDRGYAQALARGESPDRGVFFHRRWLDSLYTAKLARVGGSNLKWLVRRIPLADRLLGPSSHDGIVASVACPSRHRERSIEALREIRDLSRAAGVPVQIYLLPANFGSYELQRPLYDAAARIVEGAGLPVLSLLDTFAATGRAPREFRVNLIDSHPDAEYDAIAARAILGQLQRDGTMDRMLAARPNGDR